MDDLDTTILVENDADDVVSDGEVDGGSTKSSPRKTSSTNSSGSKPKPRPQTNRSKSKRKRR